MHAHGPTIIKLGGSFAFSPHLKDWIDAIAASAGRAAIVTGGGPFADLVRAAQVRMRFDDRAAHRMALLAMEQYACAVKSLHEKLSLADSPDAIRRGLLDGQVPIWLPSRMVLGASEIPHSWEITSDSLAAWLAGKLSAERLLLVKHVEPSHQAASVADLVAGGIVDKAFPRVLAASGVPAFILGAKEYVMLARSLSGEPAGTRVVVTGTKSGPGLRK